MIEPFVDFGALDLVGVVVPSGTDERPRPSSRPTGACDDARCARRARGRSLAGRRSRLVLQVSVFPHLAVRTASCPTSCLLVVVAAALARGPEFGAVLGFVAGLLLDLAPPADHVAGRWALALVVVGYVAGRVRQDAASRPPVDAVVRPSPRASFVGTSVFALSGLLLARPGRRRSGELLQVILVARASGTSLLTPLVLPLLMRAVRAARARPGRWRDRPPARRGATASRLRLVVIQALVFSLFATLFARLYYLQVVSGEEYHAQAASQSVREIVVQPAARPDRRRPGPAAGRQPHLVGGLGRPRPCSASWPTHEQRGAAASGVAGVGRRAGPRGSSQRW